MRHESARSRPFARFAGAVPVPHCTARNNNNNVYSRTPASREEMEATLGVME